MACVFSAPPPLSPLPTAIPPAAVPVNPAAVVNPDTPVNPAAIVSAAAPVNPADPTSQERPPAANLGRSRAANQGYHITVTPAVNPVNHAAAAVANQDNPVNPAAIVAASTDPTNQERPPAANQGRPAAEDEENPPAANVPAPFAPRKKLEVLEREVLGKLVTYCTCYVVILLFILAVFLGVIDRARCKFKWIFFTIAIMVALLNLVLIGYQMILYASVLSEIDEQREGLSPVRRNIHTGLRILSGFVAYMMLLLIASSVLVGLWKIQCDRTIQH